MSCSSSNRRGTRCLPSKVGPPKFVPQACVVFSNSGEGGVGFRGLRLVVGTQRRLSFSDTPARAARSLLLMLQVSSMRHSNRPAPSGVNGPLARFAAGWTGGRIFLALCLPGRLRLLSDILLRHGEKKRFLDSTEWISRLCESTVTVHCLLCAGTRIPLNLGTRCGS